EGLIACIGLIRTRQQLRQLIQYRLQQEHNRLEQSRQRLEQLHPQQLLAAWRQQLSQRQELLRALSPQRLLQRGFALVRQSDGRLLRSVQQAKAGDLLQVELADGRIDTVCQTTRPN
ncbi:MAG: exodeoxyribonuclease VII large subunit, partial [Synechococcaceae bacterium WB4_1_0192]|nr:exodeoxyribonuclease VII large subunit [Synechococcaceae bacterium WB4_1_0192]